MKCKIVWLGSIENMHGDKKILIVTRVGHQVGVKMFFNEIINLF